MDITHLIENKTRLKTLRKMLFFLFYCTTCACFGEAEHVPVSHSLKLQLTGLNAGAFDHIQPRK